MADQPTACQRQRDMTYRPTEDAQRKGKDQGYKSSDECASPAKFSHAAFPLVSPLDPQYLHAKERDQLRNGHYPHQAVATDFAVDHMTRERTDPQRQGDRRGQDEDREEVELQTASHLKCQTTCRTVPGPGLDEKTPGPTATLR
jgi:hypothetical protein